jgi:enoyl-CoA hydratase/carnithine racemase
MSNEVVVEQRGYVQLITINRPEARNAISQAVAQGIRDAVDQLDESADLRVGILTGAAGTFSAGMDLKGFLRGETITVPGRGLCGIGETPSAGDNCPPGRTLAWNHRHLVTVLREYQDFHNAHRPHRSLKQAAPMRRYPKPSPTSTISGSPDAPAPGDRLANIAWSHRLSAPTG